jgi:hypothetical protein
LLTTAPLKDDSGMIQHFFGAQVDISPLFQKYNDLSAIFSKDFALSEPPAPPNGPRKSFFRRLSDKAKGRNHMMSKWPGLEEEVFRNNITIGEQIDVFRTAYGKVFTFGEKANLRSTFSLTRHPGKSNSRPSGQRHYFRNSMSRYQDNIYFHFLRRHLIISTRDQ